MAQCFRASQVGPRVLGVVPALRRGQLVELAERRVLRCKMGNHLDFLLLRFRQEYAWKVFNTEYTVSSDKTNTFRVSTLV